MSRKEQLKKIIADAEAEIKQIDERPRWSADHYNIYWHVTDGKCIDTLDYGLDIDNWRYKISNHFQTEEEALAYKEYLESRYVIEQDAGGYKFKTGNDNFFGICDFQPVQPSFNNSVWAYEPDAIYFQSEKDIKESQDKHPKEWLTYVTYGLPEEVSND